MRVKDPLNGILRCIGHVTFHIALLIGSYIIMGKTNDEEMKTTGIEELVFLIRVMHAYIILSNSMRALLESPANNMIMRIFRVLELGFFYFVFLRLQFFICKSNPKETDSKHVFQAKYLIVIEILYFYAQVLNQIVWLFYI